MDRRVARLAAAQHGVFARAQARQLGATRGVIGRRIAAGRWERIAPGVLRAAGAPDSWQQSLVAACLAWGDGAVISHRTAAVVWQLPGFDQRSVDIEVTVPVRRMRRRPTEHTRSGQALTEHTRSGSTRGHPTRGGLTGSGPPPTARIATSSTRPTRRR